MKIVLLFYVAGIVVGWAMTEMLKPGRSFRLDSDAEKRKR